MPWYTKKSISFGLYLAFLLLLISRKWIGFDISGIILVLPVIFLPDSRINLFSKWSFFALLMPLSYPVLGDRCLDLCAQALIEEIFFRAYLMMSFSNLSSSFMFSLAHFLIYFDIFSALTFFPSLFFGFIYSKTNNLLLVTALHHFSNVLWFGFLIELFT
ncbi:MAG: CPBP family glutamic-type intramembrane protease [Aquificaceae bacterium]